MRLVANSMLAYSGMKIELMKSDVVGFGNGIVVATDKIHFLHCQLYLIQMISTK